jgi:protease YdgD
MAAALRERTDILGMAGGAANEPLSPYRGIGCALTYSLRTLRRRLTELKAPKLISGPTFARRCLRLAANASACFSLLILGVATAQADCDNPLRMRVPGAVRIGLGAGPDPRTRLNQSDSPWSALGRVNNATFGSFCTGALIAPTSVLTAAHCVVSFRSGCFLQPNSLHFVLAYQHGQHAGHARVSSYVVAPTYTPSSSASGDDWAILTLEAPVAPAARVLRLANPETFVRGSEGISVALAGYQQDRREVLLGDLNCHLVGIEHDAAGHPMIIHTCAGTRGTSGAPLLAQAPNGEWFVVGVASGGRRDRTTTTDRTAFVGVSGGAAVPAGEINPAAGVRPPGRLSAPIKSSPP